MTTTYLYDDEWHLFPNIPFPLMYRSLSLLQRNSSAILMKELIIIRHGQAQHNPRAEHAKANGCSNEEFVHWMRQDDVLDARLTPLGIAQAQAIQLPPHAAELVVSSSLSRALETANHVYPHDHDYPLTSTVGMARKVALEHFREISGDLLLSLIHISQGIVR